MDILSHELMLNDRIRVEAYRRAVRKVVRPGDTVLDLGTGSGILACFACRAGAARVYALECEPVIELGREVVEANGFADRVIFLRGLSTELAPPERVDAVVSEILGHFALDENILEFTPDARERWLKPEGKLVPSSVRLFLVPVSDPAPGRGYAPWRRRRYGLSLAPVGRYLANHYGPLALRPRSFLAPPALLAEVDLRTVRERHFAAGVRFTPGRAGSLYGLGSWFEAELAPGVTLSTAPGAPPTCWQQCYFPLERPLRVPEGGRVDAEVKVISIGRACHVCWEVEVAGPRGGRKERARGSTFSSSPLPREEVAKSFSAAGGGRGVSQVIGSGPEIVHNAKEGGIAEPDHGEETG